MPRAHRSLQRLIADFVDEEVFFILVESDGHVVHGISPFVRASYQTDSPSPDFIRVDHVKVMPAVRGLLVSGDTFLCPKFDNSLGQRAEKLCALFIFSISGESRRKVGSIALSDRTASVG
jgi:hypothetical protein